MLKNRLITSFIGIPIIIIFLFSSKNVFFFFIFLVSFLAIYEWFNCIKLNKWLKLIWIFLFLYISTYLAFTKNTFLKLNISWIFNILWFLIIFLLLIFSFFNKKLKISNTFLCLFGIFFIGSFLWSSLILKQYYSNLEPYLGSKWLLYIIFVVWGNDSGSYFFGKYFGKNKFFSIISPNKTLEGVFGGVLGAIFITLFFIIFSFLKIKIYNYFILTILISFSSILGDLTESMFKRIVNIKDSSNLLPGHGGILDRIDSLSASFSIVLHYCLVFNIL